MVYVCDPDVSLFTYSFQSFVPSPSDPSLRSTCMKIGPRVRRYSWVKVSTWYRLFTGVDGPVFPTNPFLFTS